MKKSTPAFLLCLVLSYAASAQKFSLLPQVGLETSKTLLNYNGLSSFSPANLQLAPKLGLRMEYSIKHLGGPYIGVSTTRSSVAVNLSDPSEGMNIIKTSSGAMQVQLEAGYQITSNPIYFNKAAAAKKSAAAAAQKKSSFRSLYGGGYCSRYHSGAASRSMPTAAPAAVDKGWFVSIQPSAGFAYVPSIRSTITSATQNYKSGLTYIAGNMNTAFIAGTNFIFGENTDKKFSIGVQYIKGIVNLKTRDVLPASASKSAVTSLGSSVSGFNISMGIPINLSKSKAVAKPLPVIQPKKFSAPQHRCGQYYSNIRSI